MVQNWTTGVGQGVVPRDSAYQMEFSVSCLIGISAPMVGCSRPQWVRWMELWGWHGAWGNLKERSQLEVGSLHLENFPIFPLIEEKPGSVGQMGWESLFPWQPEKAISKVVPQPSPLGSRLDLGGVRGACYGNCVSPQWPPNP